MARKDHYQGLSEQADWLLPVCPLPTVVSLADRGFADTKLMAFLTDDLGWQWRIRIKPSFWVYRPSGSIVRGTVRARWDASPCNLDRHASGTTSASPSGAILRLL